ncbi:MAG: YceI family protein [Bacteroidia bacterium]
MEATEVLQKTKWAIDPMHSEVQFKVKHLMISSVTGSFIKFNGTVTSQSENFEEAEVIFSLDVNSIFTNQEMRDTHLKSNDFLEAARYPTIDFKSTSFKKIKNKEYLLTGNLTIKGITKEVEMKVEFGGVAQDSHGNLKAGFEVTGIVNRKDFGVSYNPANDSGGITLSDEIRLIANIQVTKEKSN